MTRGIKCGSSQKTGDTSAEQPAYPSATASQTRNCFPTCTRLVGAPAIYLSSSNERHSLMQRTSDNGAARYLHSCRTVLRIASCANNNAELSRRRRNRHRFVLNLCLLLAFHLIQARRRNGEQRCVRTERKITLGERGIYRKEIRICLVLQLSFAFSWNSNKYCEYSTAWNVRVYVPQQKIKKTIVSTNNVHHEINCYYYLLI